jgi:hypothetical protein
VDGLGLRGRQFLDLPWVSSSQGFRLMFGAIHHPFRQELPMQAPSQKQRHLKMYLTSHPVLMNRQKPQNHRPFPCKMLLPLATSWNGVITWKGWASSGPTLTLTLRSPLSLRYGD